MLGLAAGDAVGTAVEFKKPGSFSLVNAMTGGGPFRLRPGEWTDDTSMALCLAESLVECHGFDPADQMQRYVAWWRHGHLASNGRCFDIGTTVSAALRRFERDGEPFAGSTHLEAAANGSIMRLAPVPLAYARQIEEAIEIGAKFAHDPCGAPAGRCLPLSRRAHRSGGDRRLEGRAARRRLLALGRTRPADRGDRSRFVQAEAAPAGSWEWVCRGHALEAALWALFATDDFREGCLAVVNLGEDADTTGAVYGQFSAGAIYGVSGIPSEWRAQLALRDTIESFADQLHDLAMAGI